MINQSPLNPKSPSSIDLTGMPREFHLAHTLATGLYGDEFIDINMDADVVGIQYGFNVNQEEIFRFLRKETVDISAITMFCIYLYEHFDLKGNANYGFLCPNMNQEATDHDTRINYVAEVILKGTRKYYLAPYHEGNHWTLCVICPNLNEVFWFDSIGGRPTKQIKQIIDASFAQASLKGRKPVNRYKTTKWTVCPCPMQPGSVECGYYVMRFMYDIISAQTNQNMNKIFAPHKKYTQGDLDIVRGMWCKALCKYSL
ncbi:unnamed protein product [Cuscuta epithymum]|uniref:Ubiquitin-like protease family profile domain-containing protein n=1 Tax=Cuscuta epithymum TaxID=186058 RepID=A0AAV0GKI4_9ASTE|nr:unnamed protein product [Cuscuta epithymum]